MRKALYYLTLLALVAGFVLTIVSFIRLCSSQCVGTHDYRIWGFHFETVGMIFFPLLIISHLLAYRRELFGLLTAAALVAALGSELIFIGVQKFMIGSWCPICLSIAATVGVASIYYLYNLFQNNNFALNISHKEVSVNSSTKNMLLAGVFFMGLTVSLFGITKVDPLDVAQTSVKESITFGKLDSPIEIYIFTDWQCPACRKLERKLDKVAPPLIEKYKLVYVDFPIHPETMNYTPYNLSFMINDKKQYLHLRDALTELSEKTGTPTEAQVEESAKQYDVTYKQLNFADVAIGMSYFKHLADEFKIDSTPTMVIVNRDNKKGKKLYGTDEINLDNIEKAIEQIKH